MTSLYKKIQQALLLTASLSALSCAIPEKYSSEHIRPITRLEKNSKKTPDYRQLTWQEAIAFVQTPEEAQQYCEWLYYNSIRQRNLNDYLYSFRKTHEGGPIDSMTAAYSAAALLRDNNYPSFCLVLSNRSILSSRHHALFLYKYQHKFGSIGINKEDYNPPVHESAAALAKEVNARYTKRGHYPLTAYALFDIEKTDPDFIDGERDMRKTLFLLKHELIE